MVCFGKGRRYGFELLLGGFHSRLLRLALLRGDRMLWGRLVDRESDVEKENVDITYRPLRA